MGPFSHKWTSITFKSLTKKFIQCGLSLTLPDTFSSPVGYTRVFQPLVWQLCHNCRLELIHHKYIDTFCNYFLYQERETFCTAGLRCQINVVERKEGEKKSGQYLSKCSLSCSTSRIRTDFNSWEFFHLYAKDNLLLLSENAPRESHWTFLILLAWTFDLSIKKKKSILMQLLIFYSKDSPASLMSIQSREALQVPVT